MDMRGLPSGRFTVPGLPCQVSEPVEKQTIGLNSGTKLSALCVNLRSEISSDPPHSSFRSLLR
jgi:hypothetical protein